MTKLQPGERIQINEDPEFIVRINGKNADRLAVVAIGSNREVLQFDASHPGVLHCPSISLLTEPVEIVAYITDDRSGGFTNQSYPISVEVSGVVYDFPAPDQQLAAVILAEVYRRQNTRRLKASNEGFTFGISAYARARNVQSSAFASAKNPTAEDLDHGYDSPEPDQDYDGASRNPFASGSGVIIAPGIAATNAHVIEDGRQFTLGRSSRELRPIAVDLFHDLALLQGDVGGSPLPIRIGSPLWLGENVLASGYPLMEVLGADLKVSTGNISGLTGRNGDVSRFQFTAPIGSGSSGGAIVDEYGNLVGITSASLAHGHMRERGVISENVNFGIRSALVFEMLAAAGIEPPAQSLSSDNNRRQVVHRLRDSVISISVA